MNPSELRTALAASRLLPAAGLEEPRQAVPLAQALAAAGVTVMEVTFRHAHAAECLRRIRQEVPAMRIGAGTLLTPRHVDEALRAGAMFGVTPGFNPTVIRHAREVGLTLAPGVLTPGEVEQSLELGCLLVKVFPIHTAGGPDYLKALGGPYAHTGVGFIPFGGIREDNLRLYLASPWVVAVGGSWLCDREWMAAGRWEEITRCAVSSRQQALLASGTVRTSAPPPS